MTEDPSETMGHSPNMDGELTEQATSVTHTPTASSSRKGEAANQGASTVPTRGLHPDRQDLTGQ